MSLEQKDLEPFINKYIAVGVPHEIITGRLFFYFGTLQEITSTDIKLKTDNGYKIVPFADILELHETRREP